MKVYMMVTADRYELPIAIADTITELAEITGKPRSSIYTLISRQRSGEREKSIYVEVEIGEIENEN